jgi:hypothetical protein
MMPDETGKLTQEEYTKVNAWLTSFGKTPLICPICGSDTWSIGPHLIQPVTLGKDLALQLGGIGYPMVALVSLRCGYVMLLSAVVAGVVAAVPPPPLTVSSTVEN